MSDNLEWRNRHAILLREPQWAGIAERENYKIRAELRPMFAAHPVSEDLLLAFAEAGLFREGCEFIARMTHRRAAVWWGYSCLLTLFEERKAVANGQRAPVAGPADEILADLKPLEAKFGLELGLPGLAPADPMGDSKVPQPDFKKLLADYEPPPQDASAVEAASATLGEKTAALEALIPPSVGAAYDAARTRVVASLAEAGIPDPAQTFAAVNAFAKEHPLTYTVRRADSPMLKPVLALPEKLERMRQGIVADLTGAFPEKFPATPEAAKLLKAEADKFSDDAVQAVWRWIVAPDERNTTLALAAGNAAAQLPEGMLAYTAAWSFGDLTPEGKRMIPVPPELPGTGLNSTLLLLALAEGGHRKMAERYELYFNLGLEVVYGKNLWPDAVMEELAPHERIEAASATPDEQRSAMRPAPVYKKWSKDL